MLKREKNTQKWHSFENVCICDWLFTLRLHMWCSCATLLFYSQIINYFHSFAGGHSQITFELYYFFSFCVLCTVTWLFLFYEQFPLVLHYEHSCFFIYLHTHAQTHTRQHPPIHVYVHYIWAARPTRQQYTHTLNTHPLVVTFPVDMHQKPQHTREAPISSNVVQYRFEPSNQM